MGPKGLLAPPWSWRSPVASCHPETVILPLVTVKWRSTWYGMVCMVFRGISGDLLLFVRCTEYSYIEPHVSSIFPIFDS